ncbi:hypothetical protein [Hoeflea poritis]|uniref:Transcriptional regulator n=1 Tax=Hoeflea poritis TaxID=2993659 RepID=A0ABT4VHB8_9HYPH|nr:hypothetical protein [Hoeflea poritis]MDA4844099.1 hypothetical protein [Hoeflea poritis]
MTALNEDGQPPRSKIACARRKPCDIYKVARQCGVRLFNGARIYKKGRRPGECFSPGTLRRIGRALGEAHLALVLRLIVETDGNALELYADTLSAISSLLEHHPELIERGSELFEAFDKIDLAALRRHAHAMECGLPPAHIMRVLLMTELSPVS